MHRSPTRVSGMAALDRCLPSGIRFNVVRAAVAGKRYSCIGGDFSLTPALSRWEREF